ncbi:MAG: DNA polymerase III subunit delta [Tissierellia bacterium]|nr:DNA polymerase III subunit delta [Tissierellia bacterium]
MNYKELINDIKNDKLLTVYLFTGSENYLMDKAIELLKDKYIDKSFETLNYVVLDGKEVYFDNVLNACETLPFMSQKKIVVIKDINEVMENKEVDFDKKLGDYISKLDNYISLIIIDKSNSLKKTTSIYKAIKKLCGVVEFNKLRGKDLNAWVERKFKEYNKTISYGNIQYFIQSSTYSDYNSVKTLYDLENEILKVVDFTQNKEISKEDIDLVLSRTLDTNIFNLLTYINRKDTESALKTFNEMYISNEPVQRILAMIIRQVRLMLSYKLYRERGDTEGSIQKKLQIKDYEFKRISKESSSFSTESLLQALDHILKLDIKQKTSSQNEKLALEMLIIHLSNLM